VPCLTPELWPTSAAASGGGPDPPDEPKACVRVAESVPPCDDSRQWIRPEELVASIALPGHAPRGHNPNPPARLAPTTAVIRPGESSVSCLTAASTRAAGPLEPDGTLSGDVL
jgi:hypothetical protein